MVVISDTITDRIVYEIDLNGDPVAIWFVSEELASQFLSFVAVDDPESLDEIASIVRIL
jgi:hypothetical protein